MSDPTAALTRKSPESDYICAEFDGFSLKNKPRTTKIDRLIKWSIMRIFDEAENRTGPRCWDDEYPFYVWKWSEKHTDVEALTGFVRLAALSGKRKYPEALCDCEVKISYLC